MSAGRIWRDDRWSGAWLRDETPVESSTMPFLLECGAGAGRRAVVGRASGVGRRAGRAWCGRGVERGEQITPTVPLPRLFSS
jgi:hypothetical protein